MNFRRWLIASVFIVVSQLIFWAMVTVAERQARPDDLASRPSVDFQVLDGNGKPIKGGEQLKAVYMGTSGYRADALPDGAIDQFSVSFDVKNKEQQLALFMAIRENLKEVRVNGITVQPDVPLQQLQGPVTSEPAYFPLPMSVLQVGKNILTISKEHEGMVSVLPEFSIGPAKELAEAYRWKNRYLVDIPLAGVTILLFTVALCLAVNWPSEDKVRMRWLTIFLASLAIFTVSMTFNPVSDLPLWLNLGLIIFFQLLIAYSMLAYVGLDSGVSHEWHRWTRRLTAVSAVLLVGVYGAGIVYEPWFESLVPTAVYRSFTLVVVASFLGILLLALAVGRDGRERAMERLILAVCLTTFAFDRLSSSFDIYSVFDPSLPISLYWSPIVGALLGLGMILSLAKQAGEARQTVVNANATLAERLQEQDAELARSYNAQKQMLGRQVMLEERQRIVRDMHDGIGGQLLGLMMQVRSGGVEKKQVEEGLQSSIADLRLIVDSMDTADEGLAETLRSFEHRVRPQVEAAGMAFKAEHGLDDNTPGPGPRPTLQILRILQEAVTNAMRHSDASEIALSSAIDANGMIQLRISDNGKGLPAEIKGGRGLTSMRSRAEAVGGVLEIANNTIGTTLALSLPVPE